jgi:prepilin-type N-terminal cleavage/methylation domain-containing protein
MMTVGENNIYVVRPKRDLHGFTLIELVIVVGILALVAMVAFSLTISTDEAVSHDLVQAEIRNLRDAILQFKRDTGFLPRTGPFDLVTAVPPGEVAVPPEGEAWFDHPANFDQLMRQPVNTDGDPVRPWNIDLGRGWRGPYLQNMEGWVDVGGDLQLNGDGSPVQGPIPDRVRGVADPFIHDCVGSYLVWYDHPYEFEEERVVTRCGRPYYFFDWHLEGEELKNWARVVSSGANGIYESQDLSLHIESSVDIGDDIVEYLFH